MMNCFHKNIRTLLKQAKRTRKNEYKEFKNEAGLIEFLKERNIDWVPVLKHENEHAKIYVKYRVPFKYGVRRIVVRKKEVWYIPYTRPLFHKSKIKHDICKIIKIYLESLRNVSDPSVNDVKEFYKKQKLLDKFEKVKRNQ